MLKLSKVTKFYGRFCALDGLDLNISEGALFGFVGPNGAGKTTTIKILCSLYRPTEGRAFIDGIEVLPKNAAKIKQIVGYMPDNFGVYDQMSVWEYLDFFCAAYHIPAKQRESRIRMVLQLTNSLHMIDYQVASLSKGMTQRIGLAKTLLHDPKVLILDEPASGLDPLARIEMRQTIARLRDMGKTIMLSSHILPELAGVCDLIGILEKGRLLAFGTVEEVTRKVQEQLKLAVVCENEAAAAAAMKVMGAFQGVEAPAQHANEVHCVYGGSRGALPDLLAQLVGQGIRVVEFREDQADLEQVFLSVTHH
jgi:ABC-2 type transport system ATP-binding protein